MNAENISRYGTIVQSDWMQRTIESHTGCYSASAYARIFPIMTGRLIVASSRLPVTLARVDEKWRATPSTGGLVTALAAVRERRKFTWLGWPGSHVGEDDKKEVTRTLAREDTSPVFLPQEVMAGFYEGFSNDMLWPLFHNLMERSTFNRENWEDYKAVNKLYADAIAKQAKPGDLIWIHDYQLCLVPQLLREKGLGCPIGFFLHIPFPAADIYRTLPVADQVLRGLLGADMIGFHAYEYVSHFRMAALRVLGMESDGMHLEHQSRRVMLEVMPIGIAPSEVRTLLETPEAQRELTDLKRTFAGKRIIVGVDRLDYTKGIPLKLLAFEELLKSRPEWRERVVLVQVAAPTRMGVEEYQQLKREVDELVGRINGAFSSSSYTPVVYINQSVERDRLCGLYRAASIALITPVRDGMNLVALEWVAARRGLGGSLILSEFCGAAHCLPGSRLVNPFNTDQVARVLAEALLDDTPHLDSFAHMQGFVDTNTSTRWAEMFLERLETLDGERSRVAKILRVSDPKMAPMIGNAQRPLVILDYDGTLRTYEINPRDAVPDKRILTVLTRLSRVADVYVVSGRDAKTLSHWLGHLPIGLVCEHGLSFKLPGGDWVDRRNVSGAALLRLVKPLFEEFVRRTPGSSIEIKQAAIAWHSRASDPEYSQFQSKELLTRLGELLKRRPYKVLRGNRVIEVRHEHVTKGSAVGHILERHPRADFIFCAGDDRTDEDMMRAFPETMRKKTITCWVGTPNAHADYWRESSYGLLSELESMVSLWETRASAAARDLRGGKGRSVAHFASGNRAAPSDGKTVTNVSPSKAASKATRPAGRKSPRRKAGTKSSRG